MRKHMSLFAATAIALGGAGLVMGQQAQQDGVQAEGEVRVETERYEQDRVTTDNQMNGLVGVSDREANNIRGTLSTATEAAVEGDLKSLSQRLTSSDEARLAEGLEEANEQFEQLSQRLRDAFEARYGEGFGISDREATYPAASVQMQSGLTQEAMLARGSEDDQQGPQQQSQQQDQQQGIDVQRQQDDAAGLGRDGARAAGDENVVTVIFSEADDKPELHVPLVNEGTIMDAWRIDIPLEVDAEKIRNNLHENLNAFLQEQDQWPADLNEANRKLTHIVMMSLFDKQADGEARPAGMQEQMRNQFEQGREELREGRDELRQETDRLQQQADD